MAKDCQYCGTQVIVPDQGSLVVNHKDVRWEEYPPKLMSPRINEDAVIFSYQNKQQLQAAVRSFYEENSSPYWVHIVNDENSHSFPISIEHLYERLTNSHMSDIIHESSFTAHLQPIIDVRQNKIYGYESLLRTEGHTVNPAELFSYAARSGLQSMLDQQARKAAIKAKHDHLEKGQKIFINFLPSTIYVPEFCLKHTFKIVEEYKVDPSDLVFEVVETENISDVDHLKSILETYKSSGMKVALDDVGKGYSTLERLTLLNPDYVKIDRSYIDHCHVNVENQKFLKEVVSRSKKLGIKVLAEGIEKEEEYLWLKNIGIDFAQGYFFGRPLPTPEKDLILPKLSTP
ncbi:EAL domain-containing protein [Halobacillus yeomjeoni]|uniref:EAL domain-containing protein n=1 Tax=Halobacillus yeomjeoni TaxID=311194 RepID=A0A931HYF0_9BACI|nr:EAL domain-containing protein [Halobacillus yeomjeoni]MBH0231521.1 EAL domain-containing protein [Halobacillus yeomjeoni]